MADIHTHYPYSNLKDISMGDIEIFTYTAIVVIKQITIWVCVLKYLNQITIKLKPLQHAIKVFDLTAK